MRYLIATVLLLASLAPAQTPDAVMSDAGGANLPSQRIGVDDLIAVSVYRSPELTRTVRVDADGAIRLPLVEKPIPAAGLLPRELEESIAEALRREGVLVDPVVKATVAEYASRPISVMGAVNKPLTFQAVGRVTLLDALARAEGLAPDAAQEILLTRADFPSEPSASQKHSQLPLRIPVRDLIDEADPALNLALTGGEVIRVPEAGRVFVVGNVSRPGAFPVPDPRDATVLKMLALAEGLAPYAGKRAYVYREEPDTGIRREIEVELTQIMKRKLPDMPLESNDVLYVPDNTGKRTAMTILDRTVSFAAGTASGMLIWRGR